MENTITKNRVVGIFKYRTDAEEALLELYNNGYDKDHISIVGKNNDSIAEHEVIRSEEIMNTSVGKTDLSTTTVGVGQVQAEEIVRGTNVGDSFNEIRTNQTEVDSQDISNSAIKGGMYGTVGALAIMMIPGIGPILATGPILAALSSIAGGTLIGTLLGFLKDQNIPDSRADLYKSSFEKGEIIVLIDTAEKYMHAAKMILTNHNPVIVDTF